MLLTHPLIHAQTTAAFFYGTSSPTRCIGVQPQTLDASKVHRFRAERTTTAPTVTAISTWKATSFAWERMSTVTIFSARRVLSVPWGIDV